MRIFTCIFFSLLLSCFVSGQSGVIWDAFFHDSQWMYDNIRSIGVDGSGNIVVAGYCGDGEVSMPNDYKTIQYNSNGIQQWVATYSGAVANANNKLFSSVTDNSGNTYVTGSGYDVGGGQAIVTIKYNSSGSEVWKKVYKSQPPSTFNVGRVIRLNSSGDLFLAGTSEKNAKINYVTIKFNPTTGDTIWTYKYGGQWQYASSYVVDFDIADNGRSSTCGYTLGQTTQSDYGTVKITGSGVLDWIENYNNSSNLEDYATSTAIDASGNVYVFGYSVILNNNLERFFKYDVNGNVEWTDTIPYDLVNVNDQDVEVDNDGNVLFLTTVSGSQNGSYLAKYSSSGNLIWERAGAIANGKKIIVDADNNIYVGGNGWGSTPRFGVAKYNESGDLIYSTTYGEDTATTVYSDFTIDNSHYIYFTGSTEGPLYTGIVTVKIDETVLGNSPIYSADNSSGFQLYPNPADEYLLIDFNNSEAAEAKFDFLDALGREVYSEQKYLAIGTYHILFDTRAFPVGLLMLKVSTMNNQQVSRILISRK